MGIVLVADLGNETRNGCALFAVHEYPDVAPEQVRADHLEFDSRLDLVRVPALIVGWDILVEDVRQVLQVACSCLRLILIGNHLQHTDDRYGRNPDAEVRGHLHVARLLECESLAKEAHFVATSRPTKDTCAAQVRTIPAADPVPRATHRPRSRLRCRCRSWRATGSRESSREPTLRQARMAWRARARAASSKQRSVPG